MGFFFFRSFFSPTILMGVRSAKVRNQSCFKEPVPPPLLFLSFDTWQQFKEPKVDLKTNTSKIKVAFAIYSHAIISLLRRRSAFWWTCHKKKNVLVVLNDLLYVSLSADWLWLATILYICIDRPTPIAKLTSPLAYLNWNRIKFNERETTTEKNGEQDF